MKVKKLMAGKIEKRGKNIFRLVVYDGYDLKRKQIRYTRTVKVSAKTEKAQKEMEQT